MRPIMHYSELNGLYISEKLGLLLSVANAVDNVGRAMEPQNRTSHIEKLAVKPATLSQVDSSYASTTTAVISLVVSLDYFYQEVSNYFITVLSETDVDEEFAVVFVRLETRCRLGDCPFVDRAGTCDNAIPTSEFSCTLRFAGHGRA